MIGYLAIAGIDVKPALGGFEGCGRVTVEPDIFDISRCLGRLEAEFCRGSIDCPAVDDFPQLRTLAQLTAAHYESF